MCIFYIAILINKILVNSFYCFFASLLRRFALPHEFYHQIRTASSNHFFSVTSSCSCSHFVIYKKSGPDNGRITHSTVHFKRHSRSGTSARKITFFINRNHPNRIVVFYINNRLILRSFQPFFPFFFGFWG